MYDGVPTAAPVRVCRCAPTSRAMPKSITFTRPARVIMTFAGLMSRWITPLSCAWSSASSTARVMRVASGHGNAPCTATRLSSVSPSTYSITMTNSSPRFSSP